MATRSENLELKLKNLPSSPGVYIFKNDQGKPVYIGKAKNLRNRVRTYFQRSSQLDLKSIRMLAKVADLELMVTANEIESLILESNLVHEHKPRYNVMLKDDKHFPYLKITTDEPFPRVLVVRRIEPDKATYFGPYTSSRHMRRTLTFLTRLFRIRTCNYPLGGDGDKKYKVCLDYHIDRCGGPCEGHQSREEYGELIKSVVMVLSGKSKQLIDELAEKMQQASADLEFESAKEYRDQIEALRAVMIKQNVDVGEHINQDIVSLARDGRDAVAVVMQIREGVLIGRQDFQLSAEDDESEEIILETFLKQYYMNQPNLPDEIHLPLQLTDAKLINAWLRKIKGSALRLHTPQAGKKVKLVDLAARNARLLLDETLLQKKAVSQRTSRMVTSLQESLGLSFAPRRVICFDISNTGETDAVGSCVCFDNAKPLKSEYRHFKIKELSGQDDFQMMRQVIGRYFHRIAQDELQPPDLVVVDGGKGQLSSALAELASLGFDRQPIVSLAKRLEEVFLPGQTDSLTIPKGAPALMLLKRIRDEAHRFAITYNRKVRSKRTIASSLDKIRGIGPSKKTALLKKFGSVKRIREATCEELAEIHGINPDLAKRILDDLARPSPTRQ